MKDALVIILYDHPLEHTADYCAQTTNFFRKNNFVVDIFLKDVKSLKDILLGRKSYEVLTIIDSKHICITPIDIIPFSRYEVVRKLNSFMNICLFHVLISVFSIMKNITRKYIWIFNPEHADIAISFKPSYKIVYDCVDYHGAETQSFRETSLLQASSSVVVNSHVLSSAYKKLRTDLILTPLGFDLDIFCCKISQPLTPKNPPIIGYIGGINSRLDIKLLMHVLKNNMHIQFEFVGPIQQRESTDKFQKKVLPELQRLLSLPNATHIPYVNKKQVPKYIHRFTVCMIPYDPSQEFNKYCFPMKIFEYFYMGKPVISTPIVELKRFSKYITIAEKAKDWDLIIRRLVRKKLRISQKTILRSIAINQSWENKFQHIISEMEKHVI